MAVDKGVWRKAQAGELQWHRDHPWRADTEAFEHETNALMSKWGFYPNDFKRVIDAGAGPRLRTRYFNTHLIAIEPLAKEYLKLAWCDLADADELYEAPLEIRLHLQADMLFCVNCLDHVWNFELCVGNMAGYASCFFLSFDIGETDELHPQKLNREYCERTFQKYGMKVTKVSISEPWREGTCLNYWLEK